MAVRKIKITKNTFKYVKTSGKKKPKTTRRKTK